ncbi:MAG TPA: Fe-S cluster assembly protein SufD [Kiritimatiellia bacterium]|nr:Fe-S cluster assembly protein SufD [Kiritimatiellia bacterium]HRZ12210.1 Fe-S cluster assembly protein SufD [Kiritimatiellia bacterium]HSA18032.1 Fe-S cluster assembly protein SufD [Kiritimatiellia bacterium]
MSTSISGNLVAGFDEARFGDLVNRAGSRESRERAFERYRALPLPHGQIEEWRRTDPAWFPFGRLAFDPALGRGKDGAGSGPGDDRFAAVVTIGDDGMSVRDVSGAIRAGQLEIASLADGEPGFDLVQRGFDVGVKSAEPNKMALLSRSFWNVGVRVRVPDGVELERGVLVRSSFSKDGSLVIPRIAVEAGRGSRAVILEELSSPADRTLLVAAAREMWASENAALQYVALQDLGGQSFYLADDRAHAERNGRVHWIGLNLGARLGKMNFSGEVAGEGAAAELDGLYFASGEQHLDQRTLQIHSAPHTTSNLLYKGAVRDRARSVYQGLIIARPGAVKVDAYQKNNNIVLNEGARADSLPGLEIDTDDLKCSHGSTIGNLDAEQVFYLRTRGMDERDARRTLLKGFFEEIAARVPFEFVRDRIERHVEEQLGR